MIKIIRKHSSSMTKYVREDGLRKERVVPAECRKRVQNERLKSMSHGIQCDLHLKPSLTVLQKSISINL